MQYARRNVFVGFHFENRICGVRNELYAASIDCTGCRQVVGGKPLLDTRQYICKAAGFLGVLLRILI